MKRRDFIYMTGLGATAAMLPGIPVVGHAISPERALEKIETSLKKKMADVGLNAARSKGATYADVRIGRYLNQFIITREDKVQNIVNTESYGMGIRVIANGVGDSPLRIAWIMTVLLRQQTLPFQLQRKIPGF